VVNAADDETTIAQLALAFQRLGAAPDQARVMAAQLLKRARQLAQERNSREEETLAELLAKVAAGRSGDYTGQN
jgi:hypothetical protein